MNATESQPSLQTFPAEEYISHLQQYIFTEYLSTSGELNWGRLICTWNEKKEDNIVVAHTYAASVDAVTGDIYVDDRPALIFAKIFAQMLARPLFTLVKTIYHLSLVSVFSEICNAFLTDRPIIEKAKNIVKPVADIFLTPLYGMVLTISSLGILLLSPFDHEILYEGRKFLGKMEEQSDWILAKCFQGYPLGIFKNFENANFDDTIYNDSTLVDRALTNFARAQVRHKIKHFDVFSCGSHPQNKAYTSVEVNLECVDLSTLS